MEQGLIDSTWWLLSAGIASFALAGIALSDGFCRPSQATFALKNAWRRCLGRSEESGDARHTGLEALVAGATPAPRMRWVPSLVAIAIVIGVAGQTGRAEAQTEGASAAPAESAPESPVGQFSGTVSLNQDVFFGFYPTVAGAYRLHEIVDLTFYGILWTTSSFSFNSGGGGLWTEAGVGANVVLMGGDLNVNPQVGILNGTLLSGANRPLAFEGIVPNLTVNYNSRFIQAQLYFGYYIALRGERANDFIHYWANAGAKPFASLGDAGSIFSIGVHWEHLRLSRTVGGDPADIYKWIGPYVQFTLPHGFSMRFSGGWDVESDASPDFYKVNVAMTF